MPIDRITDALSLGKAIRSRRKSLSIRIDDMAAFCGIAVATLSALENGSRPVGIDKIMTVLGGLGMAMLVESEDEHS
ncbi:helix-turn-helix transcriptional regulator [Ferrovum sp.]|uniref:helix-turn-helix domain-containing protein n=1 Tax=Ferrovum sp. TaxID=2609467 RepID=UPI002629D6AF|nr:helix-turn-helix transcriptional regulator [Ferrovum sp.]